MFYMALDEIEQKRLFEEQEKEKAEDKKRKQKERLVHKIPGKKNPSISELREYAYDRFKTRDNKFSDFPVGTAVQVIVPCADFRFFDFQTGVVIENSGKYLGIRVKFDDKDEDAWGFDPKQLRRI
ncbi:MAG TPA: hypothetical protein PKJ95_00110 [Atribacterota bacterium]|jgi:hypothetical protein|nr:hypothetical protein [Atribacterota bacterium]